MASTTCQAPGVDYFSKQKKPQNSVVTTSYWETPYTTDALLSSDSCDSTLPSPTSPLTATFPQAYSIPKEEFKPEQTSFDYGTCEDWMRWDDPSDAALSPTSDFFPEFKVEPVSPSMSGLELQGSGIGNTNIEDSAVFGEDPITEEPLFQTPNHLITPPLAELPRESLYSTPLSWARPSSGRRTTDIEDSDAYALSPQEESKLRNIAMPSQQSQNNGAYPASPNSSASSPEPCEQNSRKRKSSVEDDEEEDSPPPRGHPVKKTAHNMIEKRYRTNLNDKIAALRDSVPSLRVMSKKNSRGEEIQEDLQGLTPAHKLNKATVLSKATEYIAHLEKRNKYLVKENANLKSRVDAFEILVMSRQQPGGGMKQQRNPSMGRQQQQQQQMRPAYSMMDGFGPI
ncbi:related to myc-type bHLH transcription factor [Phialocephala subalpina]|uniref:Related to myc-type bHLH transcription factor n=1 Tax=Phialocephala subalpina TaxID=576137 RepID=A0A1L7XYC2_9HELO|nr:related to myc-type bHLH transcription factor [Phialocephala subalpina]